MTLIAMPLLMTNLVSEMLFVLHQRLSAQNVSQLKSHRVLHDIVDAFTDETFLQELFIPQPLCTAHTARTIFRQLAHISVMKLNDSSMSKLFDLMVMVVKYQILNCYQASCILTVTLKHLEEVDALIDEDSRRRIAHLRDMLVGIYGDLSLGRWHCIFQSLLSFFEDRKVKVSLLLQEGLQEHNGKIVLTNFSKTTDDYEVGSVFTFGTHGWTLLGHRVISEKELIDKKTPSHHYSIALGTNLYLKNQNRRNQIDSTLKQASFSANTVASNQPTLDSSTNKTLDSVSAETKLLTSLLSKSCRQGRSPVALDLEIEDPAVKTNEVLALKPEDNKNYRQQLSAIVDDLDVTNEATTPTQMEDELLALLDNI